MITHVPSDADLIKICEAHLPFCELLDLNLRQPALPVSIGIQQLVFYDKKKKISLTYRTILQQLLQYIEEQSVGFQVNQWVAHHYRLYIWNSNNDTCASSFFLKDLRSLTFWGENSSFQELNRVCCFVICRI